MNPCNAAKLTKYSSFLGLLTFIKQILLMNYQIIHAWCEMFLSSIILSVLLIKHKQWASFLFHLEEFLTRNRWQSWHFNTQIKFPPHTWSVLGWASRCKLSYLLKRCELVYQSTSRANCRLYSRHGVPDSNDSFFNKHSTHNFFSTIILRLSCNSLN